MANGENASKHWGREYWSRRLKGAFPWGKIAKIFTHRKERQENKKVIKKELKEFNSHD